MDDTHVGTIPPLPFHLHDAATRIEHMLMLHRLGLYLNPDRAKQWHADGHHTRFQTYCDEHPDEVVYLNNEALLELQQKIEEHAE
ncbi:MAG: hypothetical protein JWL88_219 [Parcubacteria group bacterium]|nr:hypothetical protein [Parcubacteria group bacterium]